MTILFIDFDKISPLDRAKLVEDLGDLKIINFFSSDLNDLAIISKHRVVSLPTFIILDDKNKPKLRLLDIPTKEELEHFNEQFRN